MHEGIEIGKQMAAMVSSIMEDGVDLFCYAFDDMPVPIRCEGTSIEAWTKAFAGISAGGCTGCGAPLVAMMNNREVVEQIVLISDEGENRSPAFLKALTTYAEKLGIEVPSVTVLRCGHRGTHGLISNKLERNGVETNVYTFQGDYNSLPNLIPFLTKPSKLDLLIEIMSYELPQRQKPVPQAC